VSDLPFFRCPDTATPVSVSDLPFFHCPDTATPVSVSVFPFFHCPDTVTTVSVSELPMFGVITVADGDGEVGANVTFAAVAQYFSTEVH